MTRKNSRIQLDATPFSVVVTCQDCPPYCEVRGDRMEAWRAAREHEKRAHPGATQATSALIHMSKSKAA